MSQFSQSGRYSKVSLGMAVLALLASFLPWLKVSVSLAGVGSLGGSTVSAWGAGFLAWFPVMLLLANGAYSHMQTRLPQLSSLHPSVIGLATSTLALLLILLRWATYPAGNSVTTSSAGIGLYLGLVTALATAALSYRTFRETGNTLQSLKDSLLAIRRSDSDSWSVFHV